MTSVNLALLKALIDAETARAEAEEAVLQAGITAVVPAIGAIPAYVRNLGSGTSSSNTTTVAMTTNHAVDTGDTIVLKVLTGGGAAQALSSVSGGGLSWRLQGAHSAGPGPTASVATAYCPSGLASSTTITATIGTASTNKVLMADEWTRLQNVAADAVGGHDATSTATLQTGNCNGTQADNFEVYIALFGTAQAQTDGQWSVDTGWVKRLNVAGPTTLTMMSADIVSQGTFNLAASTTGAANYSGVLVALKGTAVTPTISAPNFLPGGVGTTLKTRGGAAKWVTSPLKYVEDYGATDDVQVCNTAVAVAANSAITSTAAPFVPADVGKNIVMEGAGTAGAPLCGTITAYNTTQSVTVTPTPSTSVTSNLWWGTDNTAAFELAISKIPQTSGAMVGQIGGTVICEGHGYGFAPSGTTGILLSSGSVRQSVRLVGSGSSSSIEGGEHGTNLVCMKNAMTMIYDNGDTQTPDLFGGQVENVNIMDVAGSSTGVYSVRTNRMHLRSVTVKGRIAQKTTTGFKLDAQTYDSSWHVLDEFRAIYCAKGVHVVEGYGTYWQSGEAEQCTYGYYGEKDRHTVIGAIEQNYIGATAVYSQGGFLTLTSGCHLETASSTAASTAVHIDPGAHAPIDGCGLQICGAVILAQNGASQYGVILEAGASAGRLDFFTRSFLAANRVVNNTGSNLSEWRGSIVDPVRGTLDASAIP